MGDKDSCDGVSSNAVSDRNLESSAVSTGSCPVANPNPDTMTQCFTTQYDNTKDHLDGLTGGAKVFHEYVENCEYGGNNAISSNSLGDLQIAPQIGGTTMIYNNKSASHGLNIYGGDLLVIPSVYFRVINDAQTILKDCGGFSTLLAAMVESGLTQAINDGAKGANHWPTDNAVLMDRQGSHRFVPTSVAECVSPVDAHARLPRCRLGKRRLLVERHQHMHKSAQAFWRLVKSSW